MFMFDVETLGTESNSVILSAALIHFEFDKVLTFQEYVDSACYVKFDQEEQINKGRVIENDTVAWWKKQSELARKAALDLSPSIDVSSLEGIEKLRTYINEHGGPDQIFWMRGTLDQMVIDSLCKSVGVPVLTRFNKWRDVRTAIDILATDAKDGYCKIVGFNPDLHAIKHLPQHDCAVDILMLVSHE
jgi:hypothetical protein